MNVKFKCLLISGFVSTFAFPPFFLIWFMVSQSLSFQFVKGVFYTLKPGFQIYADQALKSMTASEKFLYDNRINVKKIFFYCFGDLR